MASHGANWAAFLLYTAAAFAAFGYLFTKDLRASRAMLGLLGLGALLHAAAFAGLVAAVWGFPENRYFLPIVSFHGALSYMALALAAAFLVVEGTNRLGILGAFVIPWAAASLGAAVLWTEPRIAPIDERLRSYWLNLHPVVLMTAYAIFVNAFGVASALLVQERQIKSRKPGELCYRLPPLDELDRLNGKLVASGLAVLVLGLFMGAAWSHMVSGRAWAWEPKETLALVTAAVYATSLLLRRAGGLGRRSAYVSMAGFACVLLTFFGAELVAGRHGFLSGGGR